MLSAGIVFVVAAVRICSATTYTIGAARGQVQPNPVTWFFWALTPAIVFAAQLFAHEGLSAVLSLVFLAGPLLIFLVSLRTSRFRAQLTPINIACAVFAALGVLFWQLAGDPVLAVFICIGSDAAATLPTLIKAYRAPASERRVAYVLDGMGALIIVLVTPQWTPTTAAFPLYVLFLNLFILGHIQIGYGVLNQNAKMASGRSRELGTVLPARLLHSVVAASRQRLTSRPRMLAGSPTRSATSGPAPSAGLDAW